MRCLRKAHEAPNHSTFLPEVYLRQHRTRALSVLAKQMDGPTYDVVRQLARTQPGPFFRGHAAFLGDLTEKQKSDLRNLVLDHIIDCAKQGTVASDPVLRQIFPCKSLPKYAQCITGAHEETDHDVQMANDRNCTRTLQVDGDDELIRCDDNDRTRLTTGILDAKPGRYQEFLRQELPRGMRSKSNSLRLRRLLSNALRDGDSERLSKFLEQAKPCIMTPGHACTLGRAGDTSDARCQHYFTAAMPVIRCGTRAPEPAPAPEHEPASTPEHEPAPAPEHEPAPTPEHEPAHAPEHEPAPTPGHKLASTPEHEPAPAPEHELALTPEHEPAPAPEHEPVPRPVPAPETFPASEPTHAAPSTESHAHKATLGRTFKVPSHYPGAVWYSTPRGVEAPDDDGASEVMPPDGAAGIPRGKYGKGFHTAYYITDDDAVSNALDHNRVTTSKHKDPSKRDRHTFSDDFIDSVYKDLKSEAGNNGPTSEHTRELAADVDVYQPLVILDELDSSDGDADSNDEVRDPHSYRRDPYYYGKLALLKEAEDHTEEAAQHRIETLRKWLGKGISRKIESKYKPHLYCAAKSFKNQVACPLGCYDPDDKEGCWWLPKKDKNLKGEWLADPENGYTCCRLWDAPRGTDSTGRHELLTSLVDHGLVASDSELKEYRTHVAPHEDQWSRLPQTLKDRVRGYYLWKDLHQRVRLRSPKAVDVDAAYRQDHQARGAHS